MRFVKSRAIWSGQKGVSLTRGLRGPVVMDAGDPTGYAVDCYNPSFSSHYSGAALAAIKTMGFDYVRLAIRPSPLCACKSLGLTSRFNGYLSQFAVAVNAALAAGLNVIVDMHFGITSDEAPWRSDYICASASNQYLTTYTATLSDVATWIKAQYSWVPSSVALEIFNEPTGSLWGGTIQPALFSTVRAILPNHTLIVSGESLGSIGIESQPGLIDGTINPANYDFNTLYSFHWYDSYLLTNCGNAAQSTNSKYVSAIPFPAVPGDEVALLAAATTVINNDSSLSGAQKTAAISQISFDLSNYTTNKKSGTVAWVQARLQQAIDWAAANGVDRNRLIMGEMGAYQGINSAGSAARAAWASTNRQLVELHGLRWGWWDYTLDNADTFSLVESGAVSAAMRTALGLNP